MVTATGSRSEDHAAQSPRNLKDLDLDSTTNLNVPGSDATDDSALPVIAPEQTSGMVHVLKLFADETRIKILSELLKAGEANVQTLCKQLGQTQPAVSHHLALLKEAKMVAMRRSGKHNFYRVTGSPQERVLAAMAPLFKLQGSG